MIVVGKSATNEIIARKAPVNDLTMEFIPSYLSKLSLSQSGNQEYNIFNQHFGFVQHRLRTWHRNHPQQSLVVNQ